MKGNRISLLGAVMFAAFVMFAVSAGAPPPAAAEEGGFMGTSVRHMLADRMVLSGSIEVNMR